MSLPTSPADPAPGGAAPIASAGAALPSRADVVVVGGGLAGLACAAGLGEAGASVLILEGRSDVGLGESGRGPGQLLLGTHDRANRLVEAVGAADARDLLRWSGAALAAAHDLGATPGGLELAFNAAEAADLAASLPVLRDAGVAAEAWSAERVAAVGPQGEPVAGAAALHLPLGGWLRPRDALGRLWRRARAAGVRVALGAPVASLEAGPRLHLRDGRTVDADVVVLCAGWGLRDLDPWFEDKLYPVRHQHQLRAAGPGGRLELPYSTQGGYLMATPSGTGGLVLSGARWATQHLEAGETDEAVVRDRVSEAQDRHVAQRLPGWSGAPVAARWSVIGTHTCDNLPIVGPLPGRPSVLACVGWNGRPWSWALAGAAAVVDGLTTGRAEAPRRVSSYRFVG